MGNLDEFKDFIGSKTNCTMMQHPNLEADDLIAGWVQSIPMTVMLLFQLMVTLHNLLHQCTLQYNGVQNVTIAHEGYFDDKGKSL